MTREQDREIAVEVSFPFDRYKWSLEDMLQEIAGRTPEGSGVSLAGAKIRDHHWITSSINDAWELLTRFHDALKSYPGVRVSIQIFGE